MSVPSPCTGVCAIDAERGLCRGCARTIAEIMRWPDAGDAEKRRILARLPARRSPARLP